MNNKSPKFFIFVFVILLLAVGGITGAYLLNLSGLRDTIANIGYSPSAEITDLETKLGLTDSAKTTFRATRPALETQSAFNDHCKSYNVEVSVLGCYTKDRIYIYNVTSPELAGVVESTAAHEFLHSAWDRLPDSEKTVVSTYLNQVYSEHRDALSEDLNIYDDEDQLDELHSRVGTQIADLPNYLENYYSRYFSDQDAVVAYYNHYITPFNELKEKTQTLREELDTLQADLDAKTAEYYDRVAALSVAIDEFNACANNPGCFASDKSFSDRREELVDEQNELEELFNAINSAVDAYNVKVDEYNASILRTEELQDAINSNAKPSNLIEN